MLCMSKPITIVTAVLSVMLMLMLTGLFAVVTRLALLGERCCGVRGGGRAGALDIPCTVTRRRRRTAHANRCRSPHWRNGTKTKVALDGGGVYAAQ